MRRIVSKTPWHPTQLAAYSKLPQIVQFEINGNDEICVHKLISTKVIDRWPKSKKASLISFGSSLNKLNGEWTEVKPLHSSPFTSTVSCPCTLHPPNCEGSFKIISLSSKSSRRINIVTKESSFIVQLFRMFYLNNSFMWFSYYKPDPQKLGYAR